MPRLAPLDSVGRVVGPIDWTVTLPCRPIVRKAGLTMKAWDYDAVTYDGAVYCVGCLPKGVNVNSDDVHPIFASDEWDYPGATCDVCGETHDYMGLVGKTEYRVWSIVDGAIDEDETFDDATTRDAYATSLADTLRSERIADWQVYVANVTSGCAVGEWADETAERRFTSAAS